MGRSTQCRNRPYGTLMALDVEEAGDGDGGADRAEDDTDGHEEDPRAEHVGRRHEELLEELEVAGVLDAVLDDRAPAPDEQPGHACAEQPLHETLDHEGDADEPVG